MREIAQLSLSLRRAPIDDARTHRLGGTPWCLSARGLPSCEDCRREFSFVLQVDLADPLLRFRLPDSSHLILIACFGCDADSHGATHYRRSKTGRSLVLTQRAAAALIDECESIETSAFGGFELAERRIEFGPAVAPSFEGPFHQWGGQPLWLAEAVEPSCTLCEKPMTFLAQVDSDQDAGLRFADRGMLYAFACALCGEIATLVQTA